MNNFSGAIPDFSRNRALTDLRLSNNRLVGQLPNLPSSLVQLSLSRCGLTGGLDALVPPGNPNQLSLPNLNYLDLSWNEFSGSIPMGVWKSVSTLILAHNDLTGSLPRFDDRDLGHPDLWTPTFIDISYNALHGYLQFVPDTMYSLIVSHNHLSGVIQRFAGSSGPNLALTTLIMDHNDFSFDIQLLTSFINLEFVQASHNYLYGSPSVALPRLKTADFSTNLLHQAPDLTWLHSLFTTSLTSLNMSGNPLLPIIPPQQLKRAGFVRSPQSKPSIDELIVCYSLAVVEDNKVPIAFYFDQDLFDWSQCDCAPGYYGLPPEQCLPCPTLTYQCSKTLLSTPPNVYLYQINSTSSTSTDQPIVPLFKTQNCSSLPTVQTSCEGAQVIINPASGGGISMANQCSLGSEGRLCSRCVCNASSSECFYKSGSTCSLCEVTYQPSTSIPVLVAVVIVLVFLASLPLHLVLESRRTPRTTRWEDLSLTKRISHRLVHLAGLGYVSILIFFIQVWSELTSIGSYVVSAYTQIFNANLQGIGLVCFFPFMSAPIAQLALTFTIPIAISVMLGCSALIAQGISRLRQRFSHQEISIYASSIESDADEHRLLLPKHGKDNDTTNYPVSALAVSLVISVLSFFYFGTAMASVTYFFDELQPFSNVKYVMDEPWMLYSDGQPLRTLSIPFMIFFSIGIPIAFVVLCWHLRGRIHDPRVIWYFGSLFRPYRSAMYWWKLSDVLQKLAVSLLLRGLSPQTALQHGLVACCISTFACMQIVFTPWKRRGENHLPPIGGVLLVLTLFSFHLYDLRYYDVFRLLVLVLCCLYVLALLALIAYETVGGRTEYQVEWEASHSSSHREAQEDRIQPPPGSSNSVINDTEYVPLMQGQLTTM